MLGWPAWSATHRCQATCRNGRLPQPALTVAVDDAAAVQVQQAGAGIDGHLQAAAPGQLGSCGRLLPGRSQAVVHAAPAAVLCGVAVRVQPTECTEACRNTSCTPTTQPVAPVIRAGGTATSPMNCTMLQCGRGRAGRQHVSATLSDQHISSTLLSGHSASSLGVPHVAHHRRLRLQLAHDPVWQLQLAPVDVVCGGWLGAVGQRR